MAIQCQERIGLTGPLGLIVFGAVLFRFIGGFILHTYSPKWFTIITLSEFISFWRLRQEFTRACTPTMVTPRNERASSGQLLCSCADGGATLFVPYQWPDGLNTHFWQIVSEPRASAARSQATLSHFTLDNLFYQE